MVIILLIQRGKMRFIATIATCLALCLALCLIDLTTAPTVNAKDAAQPDQKQKKVVAVPEGYHTITPFLTIHGAAAAIDYYKKAFGAVERGRIMSPDGKKIMHAEIKIGDSVLMLNDDLAEAPSSPNKGDSNVCDLHIYVPNCDEVFDRAVKAGGKVKWPLQNRFWGDRFGAIVDPFGLTWSIATHKEDLSEDEITRGGKEWFKTVGKDIENKVNNRPGLSNPDVK